MRWSECKGRAAGVGGGWNGVERVTVESVQLDSGWGLAGKGAKAR